MLAAEEYLGELNYIKCSFFGASLQLRIAHRVLSVSGAFTLETGSIIGRMLPKKMDKMITQNQKKYPEKYGKNQKKIQIERVP